jgi:ferric-dicitrate binding protein FerR (iron transport regulator)
MKTPLLFSLLALLTSCTVNPFVVTTAKGHQVTSLGGSFLTKTTKESGTITRPDGTVLSYDRTGKDETRVPIAAGQVELAKTGLNAGTNALNTVVK